MLSALRKNSISIVISSAAFAGYGAWLSLPESASIQSIYDRYIAREESRPRLFEDGITVRLNREAPPVAALEEALRDQPWTSIERSPAFQVRPTELRVQSLGPERIAIQILSSNERFRQYLNRATTETPALIVTTPIAPPVVLPQNRLRIAADGSRRGVSYAPTSVASAPAARPLENLRPPPTKFISASKTGLTREQILAALLMPISQPVSRPTSPTPSKTIWGATAKAFGPTSHDRGVLVASAADVDASKKNVKPVPTDESDSADISSRAMGMVAPAGRQIMIRGPIELSGGLALTHAKDRIAVLRESRGQFVESGAVWIREARYEIFVESLEGTLVAEVRSPQGDVVGRGQLELASVSAGAADRKTLEGVALRVMPVTAGISGRAQSAYTSGSAASAVSKGVQGARVSVLQTPATMKTTAGGHFEDAHFTEGSRVIANVQAKEHWPTVAMLTSGQETTVPVFSRKMMEAFVSLTSKDESTAKTLMRTKGVIWGRVTRAGQTVAGARIEVTTQGTGEPVYFNDLMLPDASLTTTGSNGLFAVPAATSGTHAIQIYIGKRISDPVFLRADLQSVTALDLDVLKASEVQARAFDAFKTDWPLRAEVRPMGHVKSRRMTVEGEAGSRVKLANLGLPTILDVDGGADYLPTRVVQNPETRHLYLPMVSRSWFDLTIGRMRYNSAPQTGNIIGFIQGTRFRVSMDADELGPNAKVIYFDSRGETTTREYGEPGGGFILLGVKDGLQTVVVESEGSDRVYAATVLVEDGVVASLSHWLR